METLKERPSVGRPSAAAVVALPLLLIAALIGILINYFKGKEVDEWLERCFFGAERGQRAVSHFGRRPKGICGNAFVMEKRDGI
ncbi:hypothetical protein [Burkholderia pyrrocinia]|uniref:hypothetical protein n=1 Tax=Burkholderia pyrrocinia TaxID=60550 RepID=UPI001FC8D8F3|nr:hypothetical protein [Burkholderia pyrrocinia]